ncbi:MAG: type II toxin-antitoxin system Phd/YefM family antitoxin [Candidatus Aminicenantes bacterium]|nr:type II toxin-antitoxin system Phd/YefM family antitoxin [Candidatus Aminicenantes bacterium]
MRFVSVRDLNTKPKEVWDKAKESELVITSKGKPIALITAVDETTLDRQLQALRRSRALMALEDMQKAAAERGLGGWSEEQIDAEIRAVRKGRRT